MQTFLDIIILILLFIGVLALTYFSTKKMAHFNKKMTSNKNMEIIEILQLTQGNYLFIVKVVKDYHLFGVGKEGVNYCIKLQEEDICFNKLESKSFQKYFDEWIKGNKEYSNEKE